MASSEQHPVFADEDLDEEEDEDESEEDDGLPAHHSIPTHPDLHRDNNNTTSPSNPASKHKVAIAFAGVRNSIPAAAAAAVKQPVPLSVVPMDSPTPDPKRPKMEMLTIDEEEKVKPLPMPDERRLFQRLWTDEDEIELLQGFLEYTSQRGFAVGNSSSSHHHDTSLFYDQIKSKLQIDFNKNQLVDKLRRLKKKYRNMVSKIGTGKVQPFKSTHDEATFEISRRIWRADGVKYGAGGGFEDEEEEETNLNQTPNNGIDPNCAEKKRSAANSRKRSRSVKVKENEMPQFHHHQQQQQQQHSDSDPTATKLDFGSSKMEEKWRNQRILELEVYSKRLELVQGQIKSALAGLRSLGS